MSGRSGGKRPPKPRYPNRPAQLPPTATGDQSIVERERPAEDDRRMEVNDGNTGKKRKRRGEGNAEMHKKVKMLEREELRGLMQKRKGNNFRSTETDGAEKNRKRKAAVALGNGLDEAVGMNRKEMRTITQSRSPTPHTLD